MANYIDLNDNVLIFKFFKIRNSKIYFIDIIICCLKIIYNEKKRNKENDSFYGQICVKFMKKNTNCENNVYLLLLDTYNLLDGYMGKELCLLWTL